jgi:hypothetical protein
MFDDDEPPVRLIDPHKDVLIETGYGLDAIGALEDIKLPRNSGEPDDPYRARLIEQLRGDKPAAYRFEWWALPDQFSPHGRLMHSGCCDHINDLRGAVWAGFGEYNAGWIWITQNGERRMVLHCAQFDQEYFWPAHAHQNSAGTETIAPPDDTKPNHVRDAVRANQ